MKNNDLSIMEESCRNKISFPDDEVTKKSTIYIYIFFFGVFPFAIFVLKIQISKYNI